MRHAAVVEQVRELVQQGFAELGLPAAESLEETILIRHGHYCGRRFAAERAHAIWFCEEKQLKFYGEDGTVIRVLQNLTLASEPPTHSLADVA